MSQPTECDSALLAAMRADPQVRDGMEEMMHTQSDLNDQIMEEMQWETFESDIPSPSRIDPSREAEYREMMEQAYREQTGDTGRNWRQRAGEWMRGLGNPWEGFKQMRAALMLSNPLTHIKNITATGGQAVVVRPLEESMSILVSKLKPGHEAKSWWEMYHYAGGALRGAQDGITMLSSLGRLIKEKKVLQTEEFRAALQEAGYGGNLAHGKPDIVINQAATRVADDDPVWKKGGYYLFNAAFGSQFSMLQLSDTAFKMISHRAKVQQLLSRKGAAQGLSGERLDEFVSTNWQDMSDSVRAGVVPESLDNIRKQGYQQAAEDTFTETPQTKLGEFIAGKFDTSVGWKKGAAEVMQIVAPFRQIYVNLMRQSISRRLIPFFDGKTKAELLGRHGKEAQELAIGRVAGAWTLLAGTGLLIEQAGIKLHGPDDVDPQVRDMQFQMYGKVGNTFQIGDQYFPVDMLPPGLAYPLTYAAAAMQGLEEMNYRYVDEEDKQEMFMRSLSPLISAVTDGPWVKEYLDVVTRVNGYVQYANMGGLGNYLANIMVSPMAQPEWIQKMRGVDQSMKSTDGFVEKFRTDMLLKTDSFGFRRNLFGRKILPAERIGDQSHYIWHGGDSDVMGFLSAAGYDKVHPRNISMTISGDGKKENDTYDGIEMNSKERDRFEYYTGQSRVTGMTLQEEIRQLMNHPGVYDSKSGELLLHPSNIRPALLDIVAKHRKAARQLMKYNPQFKIRERQIEKFHRALQAQGVPQVKADKLKQQQLKDLNQKRMQLQGYF